MATESILAIQAKVAAKFGYTGGSVFSCRRIYGSTNPGDPYSQHAWGNAWDMTGLVGQTQQKPYVDYLHTLPEVASLLWAVDNAEHYDHIHVNGSPQFSGTPPCVTNGGVDTSGSGNAPGSGGGTQNPVVTPNCEHDPLGLSAELNSYPCKDHGMTWNAPGKVDVPSLPGIEPGVTAINWGWLERLAIGGGGLVLLILGVGLIAIDLGGADLVAAAGPIGKGVSTVAKAGSTVAKATK